MKDRTIGMIVIGGPTGSGKSILALRLAEKYGGAVINADSMQQYRELRILTARPGPADLARAPHFLYGTQPADQPSSAGKWLIQVSDVLNHVADHGLLPIVVGGTGLYLSALLRGIAPVPDVPAHVRAETIAAYERMGSQAFYEQLARRDPELAGTLNRNDRQRLIRGAEVLNATGRSILRWQAEPRRRVSLPRPIVGINLAPPREDLHRRIEHRLHAMIDAGALNELEVLCAKGFDPDLPLMKAVTVPEFRDHLNGKTDLNSAVGRAVAKTRQYAKRQLTWFRHQLPELAMVPEFGERAEVVTRNGVLSLDLLTDRRFKHSFRSA